ncbi:MAG: sugar transferase [Clostridia bacterium]|nr:sugar transferase [Clostridia bacterium]
MKNEMYKISRFLFLKLAVSDFLFVCAGILLAYIGADMGGEFLFSKQCLVFVSVFFSVFCLSAFFLDMYKIILKSVKEIFIGIAIACIFAGVISVASSYVWQWADFSGKSFMLSVVTTLVLLLWRSIFQYMIIKKRKRERMLIIENSAVDIAFAKKVKYSNTDWYDSWYVSSDTKNGEAEHLVKRELKEYDSVFITASIPHGVKERLIDNAIREKKHVYVVPGPYEIGIAGYSLVQFDDTPAFRIKPFALSNTQRFVKRMMDIVLSLAGIVVLSPLIAACALAVKLEGKGRVIYSQERVTRDKKVFNIYKFRTMVENAEAFSGPVLAEDNDSRFTKTGKFLRIWRFDELPQLYNILKGDMSIVGPRPERPVFVNQYSREIKGYDRRFIVKAGLTGYAQVYGKYDTDVKDKILYDIMYIKEYSLLLDIKIIFLTIKAVLMQGTNTDKKAANIQKKEVEYGAL